MGSLLNFNGLDHDASTILSHRKKMQKPDTNMMTETQSSSSSSSSSSPSSSPISTKQHNNNKKKPHSSWAVRLLLDGLMHMLILFSILSIFFQFIISKMEDSAFQSEVTGQIQPNVIQLLQDIDANKVGNDKLKTLIQNNETLLAGMVKIFGVEDPLKQVRNSNLLLADYAAMLGGMILLLTFAITVIVVAEQDIEFWFIFRENALSFAFVGIVEAAFFYFIATKYIPVQPSFLVSHLYCRARTDILGTLDNEVCPSA
jgi:hypothetical protein